MVLVLLSFLVISLVKDNEKPEDYVLTKDGLVRKSEL